jgi:hypothetical protein
MAINRFTRPTESNIKSNQVLPRTELLLKALEQRQGQYDATADSLSEAQGAVSGMTVVGDYAKTYLKNKEDILAEASTNLLKEDLADRSVQGKVNKLIGSIADDEELKTHLAAAQSYKAYTDQLTALGKEGKMHDNNVHFMRKAWDTYKKTGQFSDELANPVIAPYVDVTSARGDLVKMIKASGGDSVQFLGDGIAYTNSSSGVDINRIKQAVNDQLLTYSQSPAGRQEYTDWRVLVDKGILDENKVDFKSYLAQQVFSTAKNYAYMNSSSDVASAMNTARKEMKEEASAGEGFMPAANLREDVKIDSDGNIDVPWYSDMADWFTGGNSRTPAQQALQKRMEQISAKSGKPIQEVADMFNKDPNVRVSYYNSKKAADVSKQLFDPKTGGGTFWTSVLKSPKYPNGISMEEIMKEQGISETELKGGFTVIGDVYPDNPSTPKGMAVMVNGEKYIIDRSHELRPESNPADAKALYEWNSMQAKYNGSGKHAETLGGVEYKWEWDPIENKVNQKSRKIN